YYDGIMFRGFLTNDGSTCFSGGRYDQLYKQFDQQISAVGLAFDVDNLAKFMAPEEEQQKICILATPSSHAFAEAYREQLKEEIVDIQYEITNEAFYHKIYQVIEDNNQFKVVEK